MSYNHYNLMIWVNSSLTPSHRAPWVSAAAFWVVFQQGKLSRAPSCICNCLYIHIFNINYPVNLQVYFNIKCICIRFTFGMQKRKIHSYNSTQKRYITIVNEILDGKKIGIHYQITIHWFMKCICLLNFQFSIRFIIVNKK